MAYSNQRIDRSKINHKKNLQTISQTDIDTCAGELRYRTIPVQYTASCPVISGMKKHTGNIVSLFQFIITRSLVSGQTDNLKARENNRVKPSSWRHRKIILYKIQCMNSSIVSCILCRLCEQKAILIALPYDTLDANKQSLTIKVKDITS